MTSNGRSTFTRIIVMAAALVSFAVIAGKDSRVSAQGQPAKDREAKAQVQDAVAVQDKAPKGAETTPLDLSKFPGLKAESFEKIKQYPWAATPRGKQTLAGVPVEIHGATILWGRRNADRGEKYPESIAGIPCEQKFATLYILHCVFFEAAQGDPSFDVVLNFQGGAKQTETIVCGDDSKDWWVNDPNEERGPSGKRSTLAWTGTGKAGERDQEVRFCLTAIDNKHPDDLVSTIDLVSSKKQAAGVVLAISVGKAGLLKPLPKKPADPSQPKDK